MKLAAGAMVVIVALIHLGIMFAEMYPSDHPMLWRDVRYTTKGENLYAFVLAWPPKNRPHVELALLAPGNTRIGKIKSVDLLGHDGDLQWEHHPDGLRVTFPDKRPCDFAYCLKIHLPEK